MDRMYYVAGVRALLKTKGRNTAKMIGKTEVIIFEECAKDARNVKTLASCVMHVLTERDRLKNEGKLPPESPKKSATRYSTQTIKKQKRLRRIQVQKKRKKRESREDRFLQDSEMFDFVSFEKFERKLEEIVGEEKRTKRSISEPSKLPENISSLKKLQSYFRKVDLCNDYLKTMNEENQKVLNRLNIPLKSKNPKLETVTAAYTEIVDLVNVFLNHSSKFPSFRDKYSVLSPDLLPILPETAKKDGKRKILSPRMLSFYKDGFFSLQDLFKEITNNRKEQWDLLNTVMDLSGASTSMQNVLQKIRPQIDRMNSVEFPAIREMSLLDLTVLKAMKTINEKQKEQMNQKSYFFYEKPQLDRIFSSPSRLIGASSPSLNLHSFNQMSLEEKEKLLENDIKKMAMMNEKETEALFPRKKRQSDNNSGQTTTTSPMTTFSTTFSTTTTITTTITTTLSTTTPFPPITTTFPPTDPICPGDPSCRSDEDQIEFEIVNPTAFRAFIGGGFTWEVVALSPEAFILELLDPTFMVFDVLSPRAFFATILSPAAFVARTLSPTALRAEVLAPRAFNSWVLSPEAMIVEVLTPKFFEPRVMSPEALVIDILSPNIISPHVSSPELVGIAVLSPKILSPRVLNSEERFMVEILSPHLLSGQHSEEEEEDNISFGGMETHEGHHHAPVDSPGGTVSGASHSNEPFAPGHLHPADHLLGQPRIFPFGSFPG